AVDLDARPDDVFAILDDGDSWPRWFGGMRKVAWTSEKPHGVGSTRTAWLTAGTGDQHLFPPEAGPPVSVYSTRPSMPLAHALAEDYLLDEVEPGRTRFTYTVALEPRLAVRMGGPVSGAYFGSMFRKACSGLQRYVAPAGTPRPGHRAA